MKNLSLLLITIVLFSSCCSAKTAAESKIPETSFDNTLVVEDKVIISEGTILETVTPVKTTPIVPEQPEKPATPEVAAPTQETPTAPIVVTPTPNIVKEITVQNPSLSHEAWNTLLSQYVTKDGRVDYNRFKSNSSKLKAYIKYLGQNVPDDQDSRNEKLAFWMNAYNAMTVDLIVQNLPIASIKDIKNPWDQRLWKLGDKWYNLDEIEHQILRKMGDPRIHFGINCASFSCPPLLNEAFTEANAQELLEKLAKQFVNDTKRNTISESAIEISNIFKWFSKDFKQDGSIIDFLNKYSDVKISEDAKVRYMDYDWTLNK